MINTSLTSTMNIEGSSTSGGSTIEPNVSSMNSNVVTCNGLMFFKKFRYNTLYQIYQAMALGIADKIWKVGQRKLFYISNVKSEIEIAQAGAILNVGSASSSLILSITFGTIVGIAPSAIVLQCPSINYHGFSVIYDNSSYNVIVKYSVFSPDIINDAQKYGIHISMVYNENIIKNSIEDFDFSPDISYGTNQNGMLFCI